ncbi:MAG: putative sugar nucleotidyl transferase [Bacteroidota bacterium]|nr:putative sugar nucleotidyl transferase [Candidatus Kapabacteria bacterium]MDW8220777.1 putative sugar nucleotidyl transferase [Bacteroidota bacterium]
MHPTTILLLDTEGIASNLYPFSILHPSFELRCGGLRLFEKFRWLYPSTQFLFYAPANERLMHLASFTARFGTHAATHLPHTSSVLILYGNVLAHIEWQHTFHTILTNALEQHRETPLVFTAHTKPFAAFLPYRIAQQTSLESASKFDNALYANAPRFDVPSTLQITYLWDALEYNSRAIEHDAALFRMYYHSLYSSTRHTEFTSGVYVLDAERIIVDTNVDIAPCVVLDARGGSIVLGKNVQIQPHVSIVGPCFIDDNVLIKAGTRIYEGTTLGTLSKVGGEIKNTIIQGFSNKQHDGCLGYSFLGEWVNLGAGTNVSDLKNNYSTIRVRFSDSKEHEISTGRTSLGLLAGDHTKSAINTSFNTGTVTGISANIFERTPEKYVPSFSWGGGLSSSRFDIDKALALARTVMMRRNKTLLPEEESLLRYEFARSIQ